MPHQQSSQNLVVRPLPGLKQTMELRVALNLAEENEI